MSSTPILWRDKLQSFRFQNSPLFDDAFVRTWGGEPWEPNESDRKAAAELPFDSFGRRLPRCFSHYLPELERQDADFNLCVSVRTHGWLCPHFRLCRRRCAMRCPCADHRLAPG
jgi:hypothetical protein